MSHRPWGPKKQARAQRILKRRVMRVDASLGEFIIPFRLDEELSLAGVVDVRVLRGHAEIWGAILRPSPEFTMVVAPPWAALPRLRAIKSDSPEEICHEEAADIRRFLEEHSSPTVVCFKILCAKNDAGIANLHAALLAPTTHSRLRVHQAWPSLIDHVSALHSAPSSCRASTLLVMGAKGVGKSSCCRFLVNSLLNLSGEVYYLETDIGQPEIGVPGLVSLHRIIKPLLQAPHSEQHSHQCVASFFVGGVTPAIHPELYIKCVRAAFDEYQKVCSACIDSVLPPLVVNSHGWATGLGFELVRTILDVVAAQVVVRLQNAVPIHRSKSSKSDTEGSVDTLDAVMGPPAKRAKTTLSRCGPLALGLRAAAGTHRQSHSGYVFIDMQSVIASGSSEPSEKPVRLTQKVSLSASELRWLRFAGYFRPDISPCELPYSTSIREFISSVPRIRLPLATLSFGLVNGTLSADEVEAAFTGAVAALCVMPRGTSSNERCAPESGLSILAKSDAEVARCFAYAFVHAFDFANGEMILHTPMPVSSLSGVDSVLRGDLTWEPYSAPRQRPGSVTDGAWQPYFCPWSLEEMGAGTRTLNTRGNLFRKRFQDGRRITQSDK